MSAPEPAPARRSAAWPLAVALVTMTAIGAGSFLYVFLTVSRAPGAAVEGGRKILRDLGSVAEAFRSHTVSTTFVSYATELTGVRRLQFAEVRQMEIFERTDQASIFWGQVDLPDLVVEARAPVTYTYYLDLEEPWEFVLDGERVEVTAPPVRFNEPAVDASEIRYEVRSGGLLRDTESAVRRLQRGITWMARRRAREQIPLVLETGRRQTEQFVATWLASGFDDGADYRVDVRFRDEESAAPERLPRAPVEPPSP